jgi:2-keto-4-pentenoate hydratase
VTFDPALAAASLHEGRRARRPLEPLPAHLAPRNEAEAVAVQHALALQRGATVPAGFKIGATGKRMQDFLGIHAPAAGFIAAGTLHPTGTTLRYADYLHPGVECELAVRLADDLPPGPCSEQQAAAAIGEIFAAIEIVENRYASIAGFGVPALMADQFFNAAAIAGPPAAAPPDLATLHGRIEVGGVLRDEGDATELLGHPVRCLAWLAAAPLAAAFGGLRAGQVILLGSVTPPVWLAPDLPLPATVSVNFPPLPPVTFMFS